MLVVAAASRTGFLAIRKLRIESASQPLALLARVCGFCAAGCLMTVPHYNTAASTFSLRRACKTGHDSAPEDDRGRPWRGRAVGLEPAKARSRQRTNLGLVVGRGGRRGTGRRSKHRPPARSQARRDNDARSRRLRVRVRYEHGSKTLSCRRSGRRQDNRPQIAEARQVEPQARS
jgi:hypothetical protein